MQLEFEKWFVKEMAATGVVFNPKIKPKEDWNYEGTPGSTGVTPKKGPIKSNKK